jgi:hypothetical protein
LYELIWRWTLYDICRFRREYDFVVQTFFIWNHIEVPTIDILSKFKIWSLNSNIVSIL